ncbi:MAG: T9SS type A sorting domain-containing protein [Bacteroidales bacterium]
MITPLVIITSALLVWNPVEREKQLNQPEPVSPAVEETTDFEKDLGTRPKTGKELKPLTQPGYAVTGNLGNPISLAQSPAGPERRDTTFRGEILHLSKEELTRLGFLFDDEGYYYLNQLPDGSNLNFWSWQSGGRGSYGFASGGFANQHNKAGLSRYDFYPVLTTNLIGEELFPIRQYSGVTAESFKWMNDTLVPVVFSQSKYGGYNRVEDKLVWFKVSDRFFELLGPGKAVQSRAILDHIKTYGLSHGGLTTVVWDYGQASPAFHSLRLHPDALRCLGIDYSGNKIDINLRADDFLYHLVITNQNGNVAMTSKETSATSIRSQAIASMPTTESIVLLGISNFRGARMIDLPKRVSRQFNRPDLTFSQFLDLGIPVVVDDAWLEDAGSAEVIFWIYPNERFFSCLPPSIAEPLRREFNFQGRRLDPDFCPIMEVVTRKDSLSQGVQTKSTVEGGGQDPGMADGEPVPCVFYTNLCESMPGLDYLNLYPNPATTQININLVLQHAKKIRFRVLDLGGRVITDEGSPENYPDGGNFKHQLDISNLQNGLYLLVMTDESGARETRRFVKN